jgi:nitrite reductase/ring-hydroxylating ferredoxin subunit
LTETTTGTTTGTTTERAATPRGTRTVVARVDEFPLGDRRFVEVAGRSIGVLNIDERYYALRNTCPHAGARLCEGTLSGLVTSGAPGEYSYAREGEILRCPWHGWEFDVTTGRSWFDPARNQGGG